MKKMHLFIVLVLLFSGSAIANFVTYSRNAATMGANNGIAIRKEIIQIHSVLLAVLIGGIFAKPTKDEYVDRSISLVAIAISFLWSVYIYQSWAGYGTTIGANGPNGVIDQFNDRSMEASALVAGLLGYLCKKEHVRQKRGSTAT